MSYFLSEFSEYFKYLRRLQATVTRKNTKIAQNSLPTGLQDSNHNPQSGIPTKSKWSWLSQVCLWITLPKQSMGGLPHQQCVSPHAQAMFHKARSLLGRKVRATAEMPMKWCSCGMPCSFPSLCPFFLLEIKAPAGLILIPVEYMLTKQLLYFLYHILTRWVCLPYFSLTSS